MSLLALQRGLRDHILAGVDTPPPGVGPSAAPGLAVYRHAYRAQLLACLRDAFEKTWSWLGDEAFDTAAARHIEANPPSAWTLDAYGADFPETLHALYPDDPEVAEIAWLDWALRRAFDGADALPVTPEILSEVDWDSAVLVFVPTLVLREVETNAAAIWTALAEGQTPPPAEPLPAPAAIRVWRAGLSPQYRTLDAFEHRILGLAMRGRSFADLCGDQNDEMDPVQRVGGFLAAWLRDGLIRSVEKTGPEVMTQM